MSTAKSNDSAYSAAGVDYASLDAGKRDALTAALSTSKLLEARGTGHAYDASRGEPAFVFSVGGATFAFVLEGLGTKSIIARAVEAAGHNRFADVAYDTVAAIVNDLCCVGATPLVVNAYFATGSSDWYTNADRHAALVDGWRRACVDVGATWGGGESPSLPELVSADEIELAGSAVGLIPAGTEPILGQHLEAGDEIVFVASSGLHANGASLARMLVNPDTPGFLEHGYAHKLPSGISYGDALLEPTTAYSPLVARLVDESVPIHYLSHITGHGMLKLMRPSRAFTYEIDRLPAVPEVLEFIVKRAVMTEDAAYSTFNMGCGFAIYCERGSGDRVVDEAKALGFDAYVAGRVLAGPRQVVLKELGIVYENDSMDLTPRRAA
jgi:phosphoribosylformylglycinamidine cyclo-ligase